MFFYQCPVMVTLLDLLFLLTQNQYKKKGGTYKVKGFCGYKSQRQQMARLTEHNVSLVSTFLGEGEGMFTTAQKNN